MSNFTVFGVLMLHHNNPVDILELAKRGPSAFEYTRVMEDPESETELKSLYTESYQLIMAEIVQTAVTERVPITINHLDNGVVQIKSEHIEIYYRPFVFSIQPEPESDDNV